MPTVSKWMVGYGIFLIVCGLGAFALSGFEGRAITAVVVGGATGFLAILMGILAAADNKIVKMVGIHLGMVFIGIFILLFAITAVTRWRDAFAPEEPGPLYLPVVLTVMAIGSIVSLVMVIRERPAVEKREEPGEP